jgi:hypothetical protein
MHSQLYLTGKLASEPETGTSRKNNKPWVRLLLETELIREPRPTEFQVETVLLPLSCFAWPAEVARSLHRGDSVLAGTHLVGTEFKTEDGTIRRGLQLIADSVVLLRQRPAKSESNPVPAQR